MNMFWENVRLALTSLRTNKSRTFLTMLGIIIGIAAVIAIKTVGNSLSLSVSDSMQSMGANNITVYLDSKEADKDETEDGYVFGTVTNDRKLTKDDLFNDEMIMGMFRQFSDSIAAISTQADVETTTVKKGTNSKSLSISGVSLGYFTANSLEFVSGGIFTADEAKDGRNVIIVGSDFVDSLYGGNYAGIIGETVSMPLYNKNMDFVVVGVYKYQASIYSMNSSSSAYIPLKTAQTITHYDRYTSFSVVSKVGVDSDELAVSIKDYLNGFYRNSNRLEVETYNMASMISGMNDMMGKITTAVSVIAGIALLVGGIGVMNIMLVSITERTREIGTRKALGATNGYIRMQFIIEAVVICIIGGTIGILTGLLMGAIGAKILGFAAAPSVSSIVGSLAFSMFIGIFFGYYPANKAAKMNPIDALRYE